MTERQRRHDELQVSQVAPQGDGGGADARAQAERLLSAADDAINRVLSEDSAAFLAATQQLGGQ